MWYGSPPMTTSDSESVPDRSLLATSMLCDAIRTSCLLCWAGCCMRAAVLCGAAGCLMLAACLLAGGGGATTCSGGDAAATRLFGCRGVMLLSRSRLIASKGAGLAAAALLVVVLAAECVLSGCALLTNGLDPLKCFMICSHYANSQTARHPGMMRCEDRRGVRSTWIRIGLRFSLQAASGILSEGKKKAVSHGTARHGTWYTKTARLTRARLAISTLQTSPRLLPHTYCSVSAGMQRHIAVPHQDAGHHASAATDGSVAAPSPTPCVNRFCSCC